MHSCTENNYVSLDKELQKRLYHKNRKHVVIYQGKYRKISSKRKLKDREYHVQDNSDVAHKYVKMYFYTNQLSELPFCGPHPNPHGARGLSKNYHLRFDTN